MMSEFPQEITQKPTIDRMEPEPTCRKKRNAAKTVSNRIFSLCDLAVKIQ